MRKKTKRQIVNNAEKALNALELSIYTQADKLRISHVWLGLRALDEEQTEMKNLLEDVTEGFQKCMTTIDGGFDNPEYKKYSELIGKIKERLSKE